MCSFSSWKISICGFLQSTLWEVSSLHLSCSSGSAFCPSTRLNLPPLINLHPHDLKRPRGAPPAMDWKWRIRKVPTHPPYMTPLLKTLHFLNGKIVAPPPQSQLTRRQSQIGRLVKRIHTWQMGPGKSSSTRLICHNNQILQRSGSIPWCACHEHVNSAMMFFGGIFRREHYPSKHTEN